MKIKFQYISDIHLEHGTNLSIIPIAEYLILAGDIGCPFERNYYEFIKDVSTKFKYVFLITGNHEYYSKTFSMQDTENQIRNITYEFKNIIYLQNESFDIPETDITVFGTTLWTPITPEHYENNRIFISDYRCIPGFSIEERNKLYKLAHNVISHLESNKKYIVITHHIPHDKLVNVNYKNNALKSAYSCIVPELEAPNILAVVYGHTHTASHIDKYYCNPIGYPGENFYYSTQKILTIE